MWVGMLFVSVTCPYKWLYLAGWGWGHPFGEGKPRLAPIIRPANLKHPMANTHCPDCGASYALVGTRHNCRPRAPMANSEPDMANEPEPMANSTYRYRDADKRRAYMRDYMKRKRADDKIQ